jgi:hypothetical protein
VLTADQGIVLAEHLLWCRFTKIQQLIFHYAWDEKSYREIAKLTNHTEGYIKNAAAELWHMLSQALHTKVTKQNFTIVLNRYFCSTIPSVPAFQKTYAIHPSYATATLLKPSPLQYAEAK